MKITKLFFIYILLVAAIPLWGQQVQIVNMIPNAQSNETAQDREPNLAINSATPNQLVGTAFTPNPLGATTPASAPIFFSLDGGQTWVLNSIVPSNISTGDITSKFGTTTNWLYTGILRRPTRATASTMTMDVMRTNNVAGTALMNVLQTTDDYDQPYAYAATTTAGTDQMYVGSNDFRGVTTATATIDLSLNAAATTPTISRNVIERRTPTGQDGPPVRLAIHPEGTLYAVHVQRTATSGTTRTANIVVTRDDNWGTGTNPFSDLTDPSDGLAGRIVVSGIQFTFSGNNAALGQERIGDRVAIAVDPNNDSSVYVAWVDNTGTGTNNIHIRRSTDSGATWTAADLNFVSNAINPDIAINSQGEVAFAYQQLAGGNWSSIVERSTDDFGTRTTNVLNTFPDNTPAGGNFPYLGDYAYLTTMPSSKNFVGVFSASNDPTPARFPTVQPVWQRNLNTTTNQLRNLANTANVGISIDPYFYRVNTVAINDDFYVRDWTKTVTDNDPGAEPSTERVFYRTSDVWNRRSDTPGTFNSNDQPDNQDPRPATAGNNFAYARVHRAATGTAATVNLLFLKSEFGTGSNYELINGVSSFSTLSFSNTDLQQTMATGVEWNLIDPAAVAANHVCMAVEIAGPDDPSANPTLLGRSPGWSNGTDLLVMADNNKAQRNLEVYTGTDSGDSMSMYAVAHNAALFERDMTIFLNPYEESEEQKYRVTIFGGREDAQNVVRRDSLILKNMKPCENRWIEFSVATIPAPGAAPVSYLFEERVNEMRINGFGIDLKYGKLEMIGEENLGEHTVVFQRLAKEFGVGIAEGQALKSLELLTTGIAESDYIAFLQDIAVPAVQIIKDFVNTQGSDPFGLVSTGNALLSKITSANWKQAATSHGNFVRKSNAYLSYLGRLNGDTADILQTVRWLRDVVKRGQNFKQSGVAQKTIAEADKFIAGYSDRKLGNSDYPAFVEQNLALWEELVSKHLPNDNFDPFISGMKQNLTNPGRLQNNHCKFVSALADRVSF